MSKRKSWSEKLRDSKGLPKVEKITGKMSKRWGTGTVVIPAPMEVDEMMGRVPEGKLVTINEIRAALAKKHGTAISCPLTTGMFAWIAAHAAEEQRQEGKKDITPYWRTLKTGGVINKKYPGGVERQKKLLEKEGHKVIQKGKKYIVADYEKSLIKLPRAFEMTEERLKILRVMNAITGKVSLKEFTQMVGLTLSQTLGHMQELVKTVFLRKVGRGYSITEKGKIALKVLNMVPEGMEFYFYTEIGQYTGLSAKSLKDFCELVKKVDTASLEFHVFRGDFENWIKTVFDDKQLANEFTRIRESTLKAESLRNEIVRTTEARYISLKKSFLPENIAV